MSSSSRTGSSHSRGRRLGQLAQGLRRLVASNENGEKENKANVSTHPKYSASKDLHYICNIFKGGCICGLGCSNARIEGKSLVLSKNSIFSLFFGLAAAAEN